MNGSGYRDTTLGLGIGLNTVLNHLKTVTETASISRRVELRAEVVIYYEADEQPHMFVAKAILAGSSMRITVFESRSCSCLWSSKCIDATAPFSTAESI